MLKKRKRKGAKNSIYYIMQAWQPLEAIGLSYPESKSNPLQFFNNNPVSFASASLR